MGYEAQELRKFTESGKAISRAAGIGFEQWARGEMGVVLKLWAGRTAVISREGAAIAARGASNKAAGTQRASKDDYSISVNTGERGGEAGRVWFKTWKNNMQEAGKVGDSGEYFPKWIHWAGYDWEKIKAGAEKFGSELAKRLPAGIKAIGLARQSVIQSADALGIQLEQVQAGAISGSEIAKARGAVATTGIRYQNGTGKQIKDANGYTIEFTNSYPLNQRCKMDIALMGVLTSRIGYYERNIVRGVFQNLQSVERAYPYVKVA
jgi:hypothetical protein